MSIDNLLRLLPVDRPLAEATVGVAALLLLAFAANLVAKRVVLTLIRRILSYSPVADDAPQLARIVRRLSNVMPALVIQIGIVAVPHLPPIFARLIANVAAAFSVLTVAVAISAALSLARDVYQRRPHAANRPIKGYVQVAKLVVYAGAAVIAIGAVTDRSPLLLLSGLGALAAVLMLVFKDTILSLVASVQIGSNDMVRIGDWIEMPQLDADGDVIDIALHTVKVQNWDKTITTIPTHRLITESFRNWRGMSESGGRRIKRALMLDQGSVRHLDEHEVGELRRISLIQPYLDAKADEIERWNGARAERRSDPVNTRRLTNIGTFRAYVQAYLEDRPDISAEMTMIVRQLAPTPAGLPLELYAFTATTAWRDYERIQADIFDHLIAMLPVFGLKLFQYPAGSDLAAITGAGAHARPDSTARGRPIQVACE